MIRKTIHNQQLNEKIEQSCVTVMHEKHSISSLTGLNRLLKKI